MSTPKIPVTILTGFLGAGKTTLLNRILSEQHGKRIAVIENEYGVIGIDQGLVIDADEEIFEMSNGCICCTVRGDLIRILGNLAKRRDRFDYVLIETTGLADPGPVAQTFFMDDDIREHFALDGIVTLVDARHIEQQLDHTRASAEQIALADVLILNKIDLVEPARIGALETRLRDMNALAGIHRASHGEVDLGRVIGVGAFDLDRALERKPSFLEPEYPFEWSGVYDLAPGRYRLQLAEGPDPTMALVALPLAAADEAALRDGAERCVRRYAEPPVARAPGEVLDIGRHQRLDLDAPGDKSFLLDIERPGLIGLYTEHFAEELHLRLSGGDGAVIAPIAEHPWMAEHEHDDEVSSIGIEAAGDVDLDRINSWLSQLLRDRGIDIYRMKGFISVAGAAERFVFQGVHMLFDGRPDRPWGEQPRCNQLVFIGRNLDPSALEAGFSACLE